MTFGNYINVILFYHLYLLIASLSELYLFRFNNTDNKNSKIFAAFLFLFWTLITAFAFCQIFSIKLQTPQNVEEERRPCIRWFSELKENKVPRLYGVLFFVRRQVFWVLILLFQDISMIIKVYVYTSMQFMYIVALCYLLPFKYKKDMTVDWINELIYFVLCILLIYFNTEGLWSKNIQYTYIWIIISNNIMLMLFEIIFCFKCKGTVYHFNMLIDIAKNNVHTNSYSNFKHQQYPRINKFEEAQKVYIFVNLNIKWKIILLNKKLMNSINNNI